MKQQESDRPTAMKNQHMAARERERTEPTKDKTAEKKKKTKYSKNCPAQREKVHGKDTYTDVCTGSPASHQ